MHRCKTCAKTFPFLDALRRHIKQMHPPEINKTSPSTAIKLDCRYPQCNKTFNGQRFLTQHIKLEHTREKTVKISQKLWKCVYCEYNDDCDNKLTEHLRKEHELNIFKIDKLIEGEDSLHKWIEKEEDSSLCKFIKQKKFRTLVCSKNVSVEGNQCAFCPARIKYSENDGILSIEYIPVHTHTAELKHFNQTSDIKRGLHLTMDTGVPYDVLLDKVRDSIYEGDEIDRQNRLTKRHLDNIKISYNLKDPHENAVFAWMEDEVQRGDKSCILFHKLQGETAAGLASDDCIFVVMNYTQAALLTKFSMDMVCLDAFSSHGCFHLVALTVLDDIRQAIPCAFLISNRLDHVTLELYFRKIRDRVGDLRCDYFMSHMDQDIYRAYTSVMPKPKKRIYSTWHVDRDWRDNLRLITSKEKQCEMYKLLRMMMQEPCSANFSKLFGGMKEFVMDKDTEQFTCYFLRNYGKVETWTYCHRQCDVVTDMSLERMHKIINEAFSQGEMLDKMLYILQRCFRDQLYIGGRIQARSYMLRQRHDDSFLLDAGAIVQQENGWVCPSSNSHVFYYIEQSDCQCDVACEHCDGCIHSFKCTCPDNTVKWNMCKHIHLLRRKSEDKVVNGVQNNGLGLAQRKQILLNSFKKLLLNASMKDVERYEKEVMNMSLVTE